MVRRRAPPTLEGWYALHDFRTIDWDAWREAPQRVRDRAIDEGRSHLQKATAVADADDGGSAVYAMLGHEADLLIVHLRPTTTAIDRLQRRFEQTEFAGFTERTDSFVSVTEASGYSKKGREFIEGEVDDDSGLARYMRSRLEPEIPDAEHVSFYPMDKRRDPEYNWYDLPFEERAEHMDAHGEVGREYAGKVTQMITGAIGMDDWEWGVTLWADDLTDVKELLYEMRFDPSSSKYADFGPFWVGRRMEPADLAAYMAGETIAGDDEHSAADHSNVPATPEDAADGHGGGEHDAEEHGESAHSGGHPGGHPETDESADGHPSGHETGEDGSHPTGHETGEDGGHPGDAGEQSDEDGHPGSGGRPSVGDVSYSEVDDLPERLFQLGFRAGEDYEGGEYGLLFYSDADAKELADEVDGLRDNFDHYDRHVATLVRASGGRSAVVSVWTAEDAAETAAGFLGDLPGITERYAGVLTADTAEGPAAESEPAQESSEQPAEDSAAEIREELAEAGVYAGQPHGEDVYAMVVYSEAAPDELAGPVGGLRDHFADAEGHVRTAVYEPEVGEVTAVEDREATAIVSLWEHEHDAESAADALAELPGVLARAGEGDGFGTMGMFYQVKPDYREEFVDTFGAVGEKLAEMDGHRGTALLVNDDDETDMFIASNWDAREDAMAFFRSEDFRETVEWGREVLADQPRHVFLA
ncbi:Chlorite dismutase [Halorhabdus utahensis DSM 12940]|uniref:Chlorite dismutase n=1 Tax=Halorhabdus utahensis (strain DSM 12940 / JCM 11049 / AX-2) TaxID=519442 RepID=C7NMT5_HALUD|nr:heme-binding protein [Halorhabdus utahensis]ACV11398.1 Chlorite dismutase [Halorhabdus utahensis DSM 12940]